MQYTLIIISINQTRIAIVEGLSYRDNSQQCCGNGRIEFHFLFCSSLLSNGNIRSCNFFLKNPVGSFSNGHIPMGKKQGCHRPWPQRWMVLPHNHPDLPPLPDTYAKRIAGCAYSKAFGMVIWTGSRCMCPHGRWVQDCKRCSDMSERAKRRYLEKRV